LGDLAAARQHLYALRVRSVGPPLATARGPGRRDHCEVRRRLCRRFRVRVRRPALLGCVARAVRGICALAPSGQDPPDRVWPLCGGQTQAARARKTGDLQFPGFYFHLRKVAPGRVPRPSKESARSHADETSGGQEGAAQAQAPADTRAGTLAGTGRSGLLCLPRRSNERLTARRFPLLRDEALVAHAAASKPEGPFRVGTDRPTGQRLSPPTSQPSPLAKCALCRQILEVRTGCLNWACPDLCGGRGAIPVPTAIISGNFRRLSWYAHKVARIWQKWLSRRGGRFPWGRVKELLTRRPLPPPPAVPRHTQVR